MRKPAIAAPRPEAPIAVLVYGCRPDPTPISILAGLREESADDTDVVAVVGEGVADSPFKGATVVVVGHDASPPPSMARRSSLAIATSLLPPWPSPSASFLARSSEVVSRSTSASS